MTRLNSPLKRLLLTGAAGALGRRLAGSLSTTCEQLLLSDLPGPLATLMPAAPLAAQACDLGDAQAVHALLEGVDAVVHLGGVAVEGPFEPILQANIRGTHNLYEAARRHGTRRIVLASSNHVTGCYPQTQSIGPEDAARPDGNYGLSKLFAEGLARLYWDRYGIESVCLRIGTATETPPDRRALSSWISPGDLARLVVAALHAPEVGCLVAYGVSNNPAGWWKTEGAWARLGFQPQDSAETWRADAEPIDFEPGSPMALLQGGSFLAIGPFDTPFNPATPPTQAVAADLRAAAPMQRSALRTGATPGDNKVLETPSQ